MGDNSSYVGVVKKILTDWGIHKVPTSDLDRLGRVAIYDSAYKWSFKPKKIAEAYAIGLAKRPPKGDVSILD